MHTRPVRLGALGAAAAAVVWHFRWISVLSHDPNPGFPWGSTVVALGTCMFAVQVWFGEQ